MSVTAATATKNKYKTSILRYKIESKSAIGGVCLVPTKARWRRWCRIVMCCSFSSFSYKSFIRLALALCAVAVAALGSFILYKCVKFLVLCICNGGSAVKRTVFSSPSFGFISKFSAPVSLRRLSGSFVGGGREECENKDNATNAVLSIVRTCGAQPKMVGLRALQTCV